jgi:glycosyltransferase involved in cell wall biosynthesis
MGLRDIELAEFWSQCSFVAGLRRIEGFELPALEGLMCGARPIMFDAPHYRRWFGEHAEYVPEVGAEELVDHLTHVMERPVRVVSAAERVEVLRKFNWKDLCERFWEALV